MPHDGRGSDVRIVNLSPHEVNVVTEAGVTSIPPSGDVARVAISREEVEPIIVDGAEIPVNRVSYGELEGLPAPREGTYYIVSSIVAMSARAPARTDILVPDDFIHDNEGKIVGCRAFARCGGCNRLP